MPAAEIAKRGGAIRVRTIRRGGRTITVYVVRSKGKRGGRTVAGKPKRKGTS